MCGIFAYNGKKQATNFLLNGLRSLEYRGYDSAGICELNSKGEIYLKKEIGRVSNLSSSIDKNHLDKEDFNIGIAHTRWATHGSVNKENTHPHYSSNERFYIVHNGIIENYIDLKKKLESKGYLFYSDTDTEIVAKLVEDNFCGDLKNTMEKITTMIDGAYVLAVIDNKNPDKIVGIKLGSPLTLGVSNHGYFLSSDANALKKVSDTFISLEDGEMVVIGKDSYNIFSSGSKIDKKEEVLENDADEDELGEFSYYMEKEMHEIPNIIDNVLNGRINFEKNEINSCTLDKLDIDKIEKVEIIASGTSYNAGLVGANWLEELSGIQTQIYISTEFKYKKQFINDKTLYLFISQSGETADTLECLKMVKNRGGLTFGVVNVVGSSIARLSDIGLYTHSGHETGVAATKTFIGQLGALLVLSLYLGNKKELDYTKYREILDGLRTLKDDLNNILLDSYKIEKVAKKYSKYTNMMFLGRNLLYPIAMEGSLKCKEITYNHTEAYSSGELKHGPLSLIDENFPSILINPETKLYKKNISTLKEIKARDGKVIGVISIGDEYRELYDEIIETPKVVEELSVFTTGLALQLFAFFTAKDLGKEIDKPRNLAKSVTVE